jgi:hypothetical protein
MMKLGIDGGVIAADPRPRARVVHLGPPAPTSSRPHPTIENGKKIRTAFLEFWIFHE